MKKIEYNREAAVAYAREWAFSRNPAYYNFDRLGGDCTNFASQCLFAGIGVMNFTPEIGWYYRSLNNRAAAWTGVEFFYRFLVGNLIGERAGREGEGAPSLLGRGIGQGDGPYAVETTLEKLEVGDFLQFGRATGDFYHTPVVVGFFRGEPLLAAHSNDAFLRPLNTYRYERLRCVHILGGRKE